MSVNSLGDMSQSLMLRRQQTVLKLEMQRLSGELTTGLVQDTAAHLRGNVSVLAGIESSLVRLGAFRTATAQLGLAATGILTALSTIGDLASSLGPQLLTASSGSGAQSVDALGADARQKFASAISALNVRVGDKSLFSGIDSQSTALAPAEDILATLSVVVAGATTAAEVEAAVSAWFDDPAGYATAAYGGGPATGAVPIGAGQTATLSVTATDPAIREVLKGLAMGALLDRGALAGNVTERAALATSAGERLAEAEVGRAYLAAEVGIVQAQAETTAARNEAEATALKLARSEMIATDPYEAATRMDEAEAQLNLLYALTVRTGKLSLLEYL